MAKGVSKTTVAIQRLLDERQQIHTWLERLSVAADAAPEHVRAKVRGDYERRLGEVLKVVEVDRGEVHSTMERLETSGSRGDNQEREGAERVAAAELRDAVGGDDEGHGGGGHAGREGRAWEG